LLYLSLATLTTLGYGDIVPATPIARMVAALEAVAGVLYIAITVARLVAGYRSDKPETA
jgi:voltage-gated potassium channel Kch